MDELTFFREARTFARSLIHTWYEKPLCLPDFLKQTGSPDLSLIGLGRGDYFPGKDAAAFRAHLSAMRELHVPIAFGEETWDIQRLADTVGVVAGRYEIHTDVRSGILLSETQRATLLLHAEGDVLRLMHIHISEPLSARSPSPCVHRMNASSSAYMGAVLMEREMEPIPGCTRRQQLVLYFLTQGLRYEDIAARLQVTPRTVRYYVTELCRRLQVENRSQLIAAAQSYRRRKAGSGGGGRNNYRKHRNGRNGRFFVQNFPVRSAVYADNSLFLPVGAALE